MKIVQLAEVGDTSDWLNLGDAFVSMIGHEPEKDWETAVHDRCQHIAIQAKVLDERTKRVLAAAAAAAEVNSVESLDAEHNIMKAGLAGIQGTNITEVSDKLLESLAASDYGWLVARTIMMYNSLQQEHRAGFFTQARAQLSSAAKSAAPTDKPTSAA